MEDACKVLKTKALTGMIQIGKMRTLRNMTSGTLGSILHGVRVMAFELSCIDEKAHRYKSKA